MSSENYTLKENFLTQNCYVCIELNAHELVSCLLHLKDINRPDLFMPYLYESQACENTFRQLRSPSTVYSTVTNCTVKEAISRISSIQFQNHVIQRTKHLFAFPRMKNPVDSCNVAPLPSKDEIFKETEFCEQLAIKTATKQSTMKAKNFGAVLKCTKLKTSATS